MKSEKFGKLMKRTPESQQRGENAFLKMHRVLDETSTHSEQDPLNMSISELEARVSYLEDVIASNESDPSFVKELRQEIETIQNILDDKKRKS